MAKQRMRLNVTVHLVSQPAGYEVRYDGWVTSVDIHKDGSLRLFDGWKQRAFHPANEWTGYTVERVVDPSKALYGVGTPGKASLTVPGQEQGRRG